MTSAILGLLALINTVWLRHYTVSTVIAVALYLLVLVLAYFGGRAARLAHGRPAWFGGTIGALFGIIAGCGSFLIHATSRDIDAPSKGLARLKIIALANSPAAHIAVVVTATLTVGVISLIIAAVGAGTVKEPGSPGAA